MSKKIFALLAFFLSVALYAQNGNADAILGTYLSTSGKDVYKVKVVKLPDNTFEAAIFWVENPYNPDGSLRLDLKNPNKALRSTPLNKAVLFTGLQYDAKKQLWSGTKIYDPKRGIHAKMTAQFENPEKLVIKGTLMGITETVIWTKQN